jgi:uncharacterized protein
MLEQRELQLSIFIDEGDLWHHKPVYSEIVHRARKAGLAGATVLRGIEGYGVTARIHATRPFHVSEQLPLLIIIVDTEDRVRAFLPELDELGIEGIATLDELAAVRYRAGAAPRC